MLYFEIGSKQQVTLYKYDDSEYPHAYDLSFVMHSTVDCSSTTAAISVGFEYLTSLVAMDGSAPLKDCAVNATGYTNCVTAQNATGTFTMISNDAATSLFMVRNPPLADGESVDL